MVVVIIIGVLAVLAVNQYFGSQDQALQREAVTNLKLIAAAEKIYRMEVGGYVNASNAATLNDYLSLMLPTASPKWNYNVTNASGNHFEAVATKVGGGGGGPICVNQSSESPAYGANGCQ
jgi:type II secretory pathway pseudopilin PulG